jgi:methylated-DNA-[protein]-cysteine S-methyltransferase
VDKLLLIMNDRAVCYLGFVEQSRPPTQVLKDPRWFGAKEGVDLLGVIPQLRAYFAGDLRALEQVPVELVGTDFQKKVWMALRTIRLGTTTTYGAIAQQIGSPKGSRSVGLANGANPVSIIVPCHRVIGADGTLTGYGGGLNNKRWLLQHEGVQVSG